MVCSLTSFRNTFRGCGLNELTLNPFFCALEASHDVASLFCQQLFPVGLFAQGSCIAYDDEAMLGTSYANVDAVLLSHEVTSLGADH